MNSDQDYTVTLTGHQWQLIIDCLSDNSDGGDHLQGLATEVAYAIGSDQSNPTKESK